MLGPVAVTVALVRRRAGAGGDGGEREDDQEEERHGVLGGDGDRHRSHFNLATGKRSTST